jgi:hypothetical protein
VFSVIKAKFGWQGTWVGLFPSRRGFCRGIFVQDYRLTVYSTSEQVRTIQQGEWVFIEWRMQLPVGNGLVSIPAVDRFRIVDGLGIERVVYFDQMALATALLKHPSLWLSFVKYRLSSRKK